MPLGEDLTTGSIETSKVKKKGKKRPASDSSAATGQGGSSEAAMGTQSDDPPKKKTKKKKKIAEGGVNEVQTGLSKDTQGREVAIREGSGDGAARTGEELDDSSVAPIKTGGKFCGQPPLALLRPLLRRQGEVLLKRSVGLNFPITWSISTTATRHSLTRQTNAPS